MFELAVDKERECGLLSPRLCDIILKNTMNRVEKGVLMGYKNIQPILADDDRDTKSQQDKLNANYTPIKNVYFVFVDVLGFKQTFDENRKKPDDEFAKPYKDSFQYFSFLMSRSRFAKTSNYWNAGQTSDSLYFYTDRIDDLEIFIKIYKLRSG